MTEEGQKSLRVEMMNDGKDLYVVADGVKLAKRGHPGTPQAHKWVSLEPGWRVLDHPQGIVVEFDGVRIQWTDPVALTRNMRASWTVRSWSLVLPFELLAKLSPAAVLDPATGDAISEGLPKL
jgi:hypothetical protein